MFQTVWTAGFAMFAMFFGSGNLIFPLAIGVEALDNWPIATFGLFLTGICVPFIGMFAMILYNGDREDAFQMIGKWPALLLAFLMLSLMGPFGVSARCIIVAYGGVQLLFSDIPFWVFSVMFSALSGIIIWKKDSWVNIIGRFLTPVLLLAIALIVGFGIFYHPVVSVSNVKNTEIFLVGLDQGYQTMDLLAAFFFSATIVQHLKQNSLVKDQSKLRWVSLSASFIGAGLLSIVYVGFVALGAFYAPLIKAINPEQRLTAVAGEVLGVYAIPVVATTIALACLTTFIVLTVLFSDFIKKEFFKNKVGDNVTVIITLIIGFFVSLLGFNSLAAWIAEAMEIAYPALIAFAIALIVKKSTGTDFVKIAFWGAVFLMVLGKFLQ